MKMDELIAAESRARARVAVLEERLASSASATEELARLGTQLEMEKTMRAGVEQELKKYGSLCIHTYCYNTVLWTPADLMIKLL